MIVVTGANGFIGANMVKRLNAMGETGVVVVDDYPSIRDTEGTTVAPKNDHYAHGFGEGAVGLYIDMHDFAAWLGTDAADAVTGIVHMGACSDTTVTDREYVMRVNLKYTTMLWDWCTKRGVNFVYASSAATYGDGTQGYSDEMDPGIYKPLNLYGESKHRFDLWALKQEKTPPRWAGMKYFNVYGPMELHKGRMASVALHTYKQIKETGKMKLFMSHKDGIADGEQLRDFVFVEDVVEMSLYLLNESVSKDAPNSLYNAGTGKARSFLDFAKAVFAGLGMEPEIEFIPMPVDLRGQYQYFTQATMRKMMGAGYDRPIHCLEDGVKKYVSYLEGLLGGDR
ncbi:ADP-glyceromanno-heptose 6-epimerase [Poriferisphaera sp. WC338]|uniref:ADP-glyceromanno-heptose 6-epimerase n=1 Tax=Poriferisphaera sp. WC338 TaxID=3425129 RepID=UPI003D817218